MVWVKVVAECEVAASVSDQNLASLSQIALMDPDVGTAHGDGQECVGLHYVGVAGFGMDSGGVKARHQHLSVCVR